MVDDYYVNVENWNHSGGIGIYFNNNLKDKKSLTISDLNYLLDNNFIERIGG